VLNWLVVDLGNIHMPQQQQPEGNPEQILAIFRQNRQLTFAMKWPNSEEQIYIPAAIANVAWPEMVLNYLESRM